MLATLEVSGTFNYSAGNRNGIFDLPANQLSAWQNW